ncbi:MAG: hypothetical protein JRM97_09225, partial [Nitrososphaerota archaeon]|nr:hypothetical protein [Nitrososphaerota archaeon]
MPRLRGVEVAAIAVGERMTSAVRTESIVRPIVLFVFIVSVSVRAPVIVDFAVFPILLPGDIEGRRRRSRPWR